MKVTRNSISTHQQKITTSNFICFTYTLYVLEFGFCICLFLMLINFSTNVGQQDGFLSFDYAYLHRLSTNTDMR